MKYWATLLTWLYSPFIADTKNSVGMPDDPDVECFWTDILSLVVNSEPSVVTCSIRAGRKRIGRFASFTAFTFFVIRRCQNADRRRAWARRLLSCACCQ